MKGLTYFAAIAMLLAALIFAQSSSSTPNSDPQQLQQNPVTHPAAKPDTNPAPEPEHRRGARGSKDLPNTAVEDRQPSTTATTGAGQAEESGRSTPPMGTTGSTPGAEEQPQKRNQGGTTPDAGTPVEQQPNPSSNPDSTPPQAYVNMTPAARAVATHSPDPGSCMNPAALEIAPSSTGAPPRVGAPCD